MATSPFDSRLYKDLLHDADIGRLFSDSAEVRAMLLVEGALARVQGDLGLIPKDSAAAIHRGSMEIQIDAERLAAGTGETGVSVPALVAAFRDEMAAPEHAQYAHWGATSQDIVDTALVLRLKQVTKIVEARLIAVVKDLGTLAEANATLPMAARTRSQIATPTSFGAVVASWGTPLLRDLARLSEITPRLLQVSLAGASGNLSAMGEHGETVAAELADALRLHAPKDNWHTGRDTIVEFANWLALVTGTLGKISEDLILMAASGEVSVAGGGSSTMPQKNNPVGAEVLVALAHLNAGLAGTLQNAMLHRQQRDGAAWALEWLTLPQMCMATARALGVAGELAANMQPNADALAAPLNDPQQLVYAEALSFTLAAHMPRPEAQAAVKELCGTGKPLREQAEARWPNIDFAATFDASQLLGNAPTQATRFAQETGRMETPED